jgi:hypothetical protein
MTNEGLPLGKVFASTDLQYGQKWSVTASHELLEMLGDPDINLSALVEDDANGSGTLYAYEVCDACEADDDGYDIDGVQVSDFVYPTWFETMWSNASVDSVQFDYMKHVSAPFELRPGGYIGIYNIKSGSGWTQKTADGDITYDQRPRVGSRRERRRTSRLHWQRSKAIQLIGQRRKELAEACGK